MPATKDKDPVLQTNTTLVRTVESNLKLKLEHAGEIRFREALLAHAATAITSMNQGLITRLYTAVCEVEFPKPEIISFRQLLQRQIAKNLDIKPLPKTPA